MTQPSTTRHYAYISTGKLSAMFTLWTGRESDDPAVNAFLEDHYICNLAGLGNDEVAIEKARDYCDRMSDRMGVALEFRGIWDEPGNKRRGKLSVRDTANLEAIARGEFPFGKNAGKAISSADDGYILYFADKHGDESVVIRALAAACMGVALERDLIAKRDAQRAERSALDAASQFIGSVGERRVFSGEVISAFFKDNGCGYADRPEGYWISKVRVSGSPDLVAYFGSFPLGERGQIVSFKATVKAHDEYQGIKTTKVNRPKLQGENV